MCKLLLSLLVLGFAQVILSSPLKVATVKIADVDLLNVLPLEDILRNSRPKRDLVKVAALNNLDVDSVVEDLLSLVPSSLTLPSRPALPVLGRRSKRDLVKVAALNNLDVRSVLGDALSLVDSLPLPSVPALPALPALTALPALPDGDRRPKRDLVKVAALNNLDVDSVVEDLLSLVPSSLTLPSRPALPVLGRRSKRDLVKVSALNNLDVGSALGAVARILPL